MAGPHFLFGPETQLNGSVELSRAKRLSCWTSGVNAPVLQAFAPLPAKVSGRKNVWALPDWKISCAAQPAAVAQLRCALCLQGGSGSQVASKRARRRSRRSVAQWFLFREDGEARKQENYPIPRAGANAITMLQCCGQGWIQNYLRGCSVCLDRSPRLVSEGGTLVGQQKRSKLPTVSLSVSAWSESLCGSFWFVALRGWLAVPFHKDQSRGKFVLLLLRRRHSFLQPRSGGCSLFLKPARLQQEND